MVNICEREIVKNHANAAAPKIDKIGTIGKKREKINHENIFL